MMIIKTTKTYATYDNAVTALKTACTKVGYDFDTIRWMIASVDGRFAPVVMLDEKLPNSGLFLAMHANVTVVR